MDLQLLQLFLSALAAGANRSLMNEFFTLAHQCPDVCELLRRADPNALQSPLLKFLSDVRWG